MAIDTTPTTDLPDRHTKATQLILDEKFKAGNIKNLYIPEILEGIAEISSHKQKIEALKHNSERSLNTLLYYAFREDRSPVTKEWFEDESIKYPCSEDDDFSIAPSSLFAEARRFYIFYKEDLSDARKKNLLYEMLESLHPTEANVLKGMFLGKLPYKGITKNLTKAAFPDLFAAEGDESKEESTENTTGGDE